MGSYERLKFLSTVHLNGGQSGDENIYSTPKLKELQSHKLRLKQPLLCATTKPISMQIRCTIMEKQRQTFCAYTSVCVTTFTILIQFDWDHVKMFIMPKLKVLMRLKFRHMLTLSGAIITPNLM